MTDNKAHDNFPARLRGLRLLIGKDNKPMSGRLFAQYVHIPAGTVRSIEAGTRPLSEEDEEEIRLWIGAEWNKARERWVCFHDNGIPYNRSFFEVYTAAQFDDFRLRDINTHMIALALIYLMQALPDEFYRYAVFLVFRFLIGAAEKFAPDAVPAMEKLRPRPRVLLNAQTGQIAYSAIDHPHCAEVRGSEVITQKGDDLILNFHNLAFSNPRREEYLQFGDAQPQPKAKRLSRKKS